MMAIAGSLVAKKTVPASAGTFPTTGGLFVGLLVGVILIIGGLTFFPALALGPDRRASRDARRHVCSESQFSAGVDSSMASLTTRRKRMPVRRLLDPKIVVPAIGAAFVKLDPRDADQEPGDVRGRGRRRADHGPLPSRPASPAASNLGFSFQIILWLWFTVLFANFAEAVAEGRGKAQADALRRTRTETTAKLLPAPATATTRLVAGAEPRSSAISSWSRPATSSRATAR